MKIGRTVFSIFMARSKQKKKATPGQEALSTAKISNRYFLAAYFLFALQGGVALLGAVDLVIPDLPSPVPAEYGRSIHLGLAVLWPLIGTMGLINYFVQSELQRTIYSYRLLRWQFWLVFLSALAIYSTLALGIGNGREYLEGLPVFYLGVCLSLMLGIYNLFRTIIKAGRASPPVVCMVSGMMFLFLLLLPNAFSHSNPVADESIRFWVVHSWEEVAFELTTTGIVAAFLLETALADRKTVEKLLYLEITLTTVGGLFGVGHHYFWLGFPAYWLIIGTAFSCLQVVPVILLGYLAYKALRLKQPLSKRVKLSWLLILSSLFYHITGAAGLGLTITVPMINLYMHGTLLTSGHAHLALFGSLGLLVLGGSFYCLSSGAELDDQAFRRGKAGVLLLNGGLLAMGTALILAGMIETYLLRVAGMNFSAVQGVIRPYLLARAGGGLIFTSGDLLLAWTIFTVYKGKRARANPAPAK